MNRIHFTTFVASVIRRFPILVDIINKIAHKISPEKVIVLDYPLILKRRWDERNPHELLYTVINENRENYKEKLEGFLALSKYLVNIPEQQKTGSEQSGPHWINGAMPALDGVALYGFVQAYKPKIYIEVGSGNSTKFAHKAIIDHNLQTKIISIDPCPRSEIDKICDEVIRKPVEEVDLQIFDRLGENDILYIDNSHTVFMNSDSTTLFLDVIPRLKAGILVEIHDVTLPYDYPDFYIHKYYSEQYLLAAYLLAGNMFDIVLPNLFVSYDVELRNLLDPLWEKQEMKNVEKYGCSFWMKKR